MEHNSRAITPQGFLPFIRRQSVCIAAIAGILLGSIPSACFISAGRERATAANSGPKRYELTGVVKSMNAADQTAVISHDKVGNYMPAMTMTYKIKDDKGFAAMHEGDRITATLVVTDSAEMWLENVRATSTKE